MGWLARHWPLTLGMAMVAALVSGVALSFTSPPHPGPFAGLGSAGPGFTNRDLARALGDSGDLFVSPWITCRTRSGRVDNRPFNRRCLRRDMEGPCYPGTGETRTAIFVRIRARRYHVVDERVLWVAPACASVA